MLRRVTLMCTLAAITAVVVLTLTAGGAPAEPGKTIQCVSGKVCKGTTKDDTIYGSSGDDDISPGSGADTVYAADGNDLVRHSGGNDYIEGGLGTDTLRGGFGLDKIFANAPSTDLISGQVIDSADNDHDLVDCAYLVSRGDPKPDLGYGEPTDTVVDCSNRDDQAPQ